MDWWPQKCPLPSQEHVAYERGTCDVYVGFKHSPLSCLCIQEAGWVSEKPTARGETFRCRSLPARPCPAAVSR